MKNLNVMTFLIISLITLNFTGCNLESWDAETESLEETTTEGGSVDDSDDDSEDTDTDEEVVASDAPLGLSFARNALLQVGDISQFEIGDYVSNNKEEESEKALGLVLHTFSSTGGLSTDSNQYIAVKVISGVFEDNDELDNIKKYRSRETSILPEGIRYYSAAFYVSNGTNFSADSDSNDLFIGVSYNSAGNKGRTAYVRDRDGSGVGTDSIIYARVEEGVFQTGSAISGNTNSSGSAIAGPVIITDIEANNLTLTLSALNAKIEPGIDITGDSAGSILSPNSDGVGFIHSGSSTSTSLDISVSKGLFTNINSTYGISDVDFENPHSNTDNVSISQVAYKHAYYLYRDESATIKMSLEEGIEGSTFTFDKALPEGLEFDEDTLSISGVPVDVTTGVEDYVLTVENSEGATTHSFSLKVYDHFSIELKDPGHFYALHKEGQGNAATSCRVLKTQIDASGANAGNVKDIFCMLDVAEHELYEQGFELTVRYGSNDLCQSIRQRPFLVYKYEPATTAIAVTRNTGDFEACGVAEWPGGDPTGGALCTGIFTDADGNEVNCDAGAVTINETFYAPAPGCGTTVTPAADSVECGGHQTACIAPNSTLSSEDLRNGFTSFLHELEDDSSNFDISYEAPFKAEPQQSTNLSLANYPGNSCAAGTYGFDFTTWISYTSTADPLTINDPLATGTNNSTYEYSCLDGAGDIRARIRLLVRDWDRTFELSNDIDQISPTTLMNDATSDVFGQPYNDRTDWENNGTSNCDGTANTRTYPGNGL